MKVRARCVSVIACLASGGLAAAQEASRDLTWTTIPAMPPDVEAMAPWIRPQAGQPAVLDEARLDEILRSAPLEDTPAAAAPIVVWFPTPGGTFERFLVVESPILTPDFAAARPDLRTYRGWGIDDPYASTRFDRTPEGFHAMVATPAGHWFIDPYSRGDTVFYTSYFKRDYAKPGANPWVCEVSGDAPPMEAPVQGIFDERLIVTRRQYRLALAATAEYTAVFAQAGDTDAQKKARAQSAMTTTVNRVNVVYENDLNIRLSLINNTNIIYTNAGSDPYTNNDGGAMLSQNQSTLTSVIGSGNYDVGHVFSTGGGGVAGLGVACRSSNKAWGVTGLNQPFGDGFDIDYVAHEMGHQFGAPHTFMGTGGACSGNASSSDAYEPGSGSTIMAYAGICGSDDLQAHSDAYFHHSSIQRIATYMTGSGNCSSNTATANNTPVISAGPNFTIPVGTPFMLTPASFSDPDSNPLTFTWEQRDAAVRFLPASDPGTGSIFRPRNPTASPAQSFPPADDVADGTLDRGDLWPATARTMNFRLTARDNVVGGGGVTVMAANRVITTTLAAGPFAVTYPNTAVVLGGSSTITALWNVAGTTGNGVNCASVDILISTDGGATFPTVLASGVPNDGSHPVVLPNVQTSTARIMVRGANHIFYDISDRGFRINQVSLPPADPTGATANPQLVCIGQSTQLTANVGAGEDAVWYLATCGGLPAATGNPATITPTSSGVYFAKARRISDGALSTGCAQVTVFVTQNPAAPSGASSNRSGICPGDGTVVLTAVGGSGATLRWVEGSCAGPTVGVGNDLEIPAPSATTTYYARWETACGVSACAPATVTVSNGPDFNGDGFVDFFDYDDFVTCYETGSCPPGTSADFNNDGFADFFDYDDFVAAYEAGC